MKEQINEHALAQLFTEARSYPAWQQRHVTDDLLHTVYNLAKWGPTSMNCQPMRLVFVRSEEAKEKLVTALAAGNVDKVRAAPVTAIIGYDMAFYEQLATQAPHSANADKMFIKNSEFADSTAFRNGSLQGAYLLPPDLFVHRLDRELLEKMVADLIASDGLEERWEVAQEDEL